jgi:hypothetical protein
MLEALLAFSEIGEVDMALNIEIDGEEKTLSEWIDKWDDLPEQSKKTLIMELLTRDDDHIFDDSEGGIKDSM